MEAAPPVEMLLRHFLLTKTEPFDKLAILVDIFFGKILQQLLALTYHRDQSATARVIFLVRPQVLREHLNSVGKEGNLPFHGSGVFF